MVADMIAKLEKEAEEDATEKAYCDEEMSKTEAKKVELEEDLAKLVAKLDEDAANSARLKQEVKETQEMLANLAKEQAEMDQIRSEEHAETCRQARISNSASVVCRRHLMFFATTMVVPHSCNQICPLPWLNPRFQLTANLVVLVVASSASSRSVKVIFQKIWLR